MLPAFEWSIFEGMVKDEAMVNAISEKRYMKSFQTAVVERTANETKAIVRRNVKICYEWSIKRQASHRNKYSMQFCVLSTKTL